MKVSENVYKTIYYAKDLLCVEVYLNNTIVTDKIYMEQTIDWLTVVDNMNADIFLIDMSNFSHILSDETVTAEALLIAKHTIKSNVRKGAFVIGNIQSTILWSDNDYKKGSFEYFTDIETAYNWLII